MALRPISRKEKHSDWLPRRREETEVAKQGKEKLLVMPAEKRRGRRL